jgi:DNA-binding NarL/FixJ family response regulator
VADRGYGFRRTKERGGERGGTTHCQTIGQAFDPCVERGPMSQAVSEQVPPALHPVPVADPVRVLVVEDQRLFAEVVCRSLQSDGMVVLGIATTGREALVAARAERPDVVLMDFGLPDESGLSVGRRIIEELPGTKVIGLTALAGDRAAREAGMAGFHGCLTKDANIARLTDAIRQVVGGVSVFPKLALPRAGFGRTWEFNATGLLVEQLTSREREILGILASGATTEQIAATLVISQHTVRTHVQAILQKLVVHSRLEAVAFAVRHGLVAVPAGPQAWAE